MGSVQVFPRRPSAARSASWRAVAVPGGEPLRVRVSRLEDYAAIRALQRRSAPHLPALSLRQFESRRSLFPEGQVVAEHDGAIVGAAASLIVDWDDYGVDHTWKQVTGEALFTTHDPSGETLYGAELVVDEARGGFPAARALMQARRRLCRRKNLRRIIAASPLAAYREPITPERYAMGVIWGDIADAWLRLQLAQGLQYCGIAHGWLPEDAACCGHAALLAWLNPLHSPGGPPAFIQSDRARKCA